MSYEVKEYLVPVSAESPCGDNQEYNNLYLEMDSLAQGTPEQSMGDSTVEGKAPDWRQLEKNCLELWSLTRDLRVACYLAVSGLALRGLSGFADGLEFVKYLFAEHWDGFYPRLDPDDDNDPMERVNILSMISPPPGAYDDPLHFLSLFRENRLSPVGAAYTLRDLLIATGELATHDTPVDYSLIVAEMTAVPREVLTEQNTQITRISGLLQDISAMFSEKTSGYPLEFGALTGELKQLSRFYSRFATDAAMQGADATAENGADSGVVSADAAASVIPGGKVDLSAVRVRNRTEALMLLRKCSDYFESAEPTSPVQFFIKRALRMAEMNFMDILTEMEPNSTDHMREILGVIPPKDEY